MGSPKDEPGRREDELQHKVILTKGFWIADTPVTQALWQVVMGENPSYFLGEERPVENVSWMDAQAFIAKMNGMKAELKLCLPTEAQWEYACRAGTLTPFFCGNQIDIFQVNYDSLFPYNFGKSYESRQQTVNVNDLLCNDWGLYQMHGNVWEWCQDCYDGYPSDPITDPEEGSKNDYCSYHRVLRGGLWFISGVECRYASRDHDRSTNRFDVSGGFRLVRGHALKPVRVLGRVQ